MRALFFNKAGRNFLLWTNFRFVFYTLFFTPTIGACLILATFEASEYSPIISLVFWLIVSIVLIYHPSIFVDRTKYSFFAKKISKNTTMSTASIGAVKWLWFPGKTYTASLPLKTTPLLEIELENNAFLRVLIKKSHNIIKIEANNGDFFYIVKDFFTPEELAYFLPKESPPLDQTPRL
jgi:hypothetical protein